MAGSRYSQAHLALIRGGIMCMRNRKGACACSEWVLRGATAGEPYCIGILNATGREMHLVGSGRGSVPENNANMMRPIPPTLDRWAHRPADIQDVLDDLEIVLRGCRFRCVKLDPERGTRRDAFSTLLVMIEAAEYAAFCLKDLTAIPE